MSSNNSGVDTTVCVVGLGYVGLTLAVALADVGYTVIGVEVRSAVVERLQAGESHFYEPGINQKIRRFIASGRLRVSETIPEHSGATIFVVTVGTPLGEDGCLRTDMIVKATEEIAAHLLPGSMVIMRSTVRLGTTREIVMPLLNAAGASYDIAFCPERTVEGQALAELRTLPQIIGADTEAAAARAARFFHALTPTIVKVSSIEVAEVTKLVDNTYRDLTFAFANEVADLCDAAGISAREVITAGKLGYPRTSVPLPGPVGGPCLNKDTHILVESVRQKGTTPAIALQARRLNEQQPAAIAERLSRYLKKQANWPSEPVIAVLGLAFKGRPATDDLRGTMAKPLVQALRRFFPTARIRVWDPLVLPAVCRAEFEVDDAAASVNGAIDGAHLVCIANNHKCFEEVVLEEWGGLVAKPALIYDFWNHFKQQDLALPDGVAYIALGDGQLPIC